MTNKLPPGFDPDTALLSTRQAAQVMGITPRHVHRVLEPVLVVDGRPLWSERSALAWERRRVASPPVGQFPDAEPIREADRAELGEGWPLPAGRTFCDQYGHSFRRGWCGECLTYSETLAAQVHPNHWDQPAVIATVQLGRP